MAKGVTCLASSVFLRPLMGELTQIFEYGKRLYVWSLEDRRVRADLIEVFKIVHGLSSVKFDTFFEFSPCGWTRGHSLKLNKNRVRTDLRQHFFSERVINTWNKLDNDTVCASSLICFKRHLEKLHKDESFHRLL